MVDLYLCTQNATTITMGSVLLGATTARKLTIWPVTIKVQLLLYKQRVPGADLEGVTCFMNVVFRGHLKNDCTRLKISRNSGNQYGKVVATSRAYVVGFNVVTSTFLLNNRYASILFDTGADRSFVSSTFSSIIDIVDRLVEEVEELDNQRAKLVVELVTEMVKEMTKGDVMSANVGNGQISCSYKEFMACNPKNYDEKGGAIVYTYSIEKIESVQDMSGCGANQKVKYTAGSFIGKALTWWNTQVQTIGREASVGMTWEDFKGLMRKDFYPNNELQKLETKFWCNAMVRAGHAAYTDRFHELARLVPYLVTPENKRIERMLTDEAIRNGSLRKNTEKRGNGGELSGDGNVQDDNKRSRTGREFATITTLLGKSTRNVNLDNSTNNVLIPLDSWTSGLLVYKSSLSEPEREFRSSRRHFKSLSLDELRSLDFNLFSNQEYSDEEEAEAMAKTIEQYMSKTRTDYGSGVARPKIEEKDSFELKGQFLKEL
ncbi:reverse transcriptase domain-containing protein [Tanacetum coccineum]